MYNIYAIKYQLPFSELIPINIISISLKYSPLRRSVVLCCTARLINLANCLFWYNKTNTDLSLRPIEMSPERHFYLYFLDASLRDISVRWKVCICEFSVSLESGEISPKQKVCICELPVCVERAAGNFPKTKSFYLWILCLSRVWGNFPKNKKVLFVNFLSVWSCRKVP